MARRDWDRFKREEAFSGAKCAMSIKRANMQLFRLVMAGSTTRFHGDALITAVSAK